MHLGHGLLTPECAAAGFGAAALGAGLLYPALRRSAAAGEPPRSPGAFALATAGVFALQACNVELLPGLASGHALGGFALACWFGSWRGLLGMSLVLAAQCALFGDGAASAYGWNLFAMGVLPCLVVFPAWRALFGRAAGWTYWLSLAAASWLSVCAAALVCGAVAATAVPAADRWSLAALLLGIHALIGVWEALVTAAALAAARRAERAPTAPALTWLAGLACLAGALVWGGSPLASGLPDGLEFGLARHGMVMTPGASWFGLGVEGLLALVLGAAVVLGCAWIAAWAVTRPTPAPR